MSYFVNVKQQYLNRYYYRLLRDIRTPIQRKETRKEINPEDSKKKKKKEPYCFSKSKQIEMGGFFFFFFENNTVERRHKILELK